MIPKEGIPFDGFGQVIEMLHEAEPAFREKIIRGIAEKDPKLAQKLLQATKNSLNGSRETFERSQKILADSRKALLNKHYS